MIRATVTPARGVDLFGVIGVPVPGDLILPFASWPLDDDAPIELPGCTVRRWAPPPPAKPTFKKKETPGLQALPDLSRAADVGPPLAPIEVWVWLLERLPRLGAVDPVDPAGPAFQRIVAAARAGLASARVNPGANIGTEWARLAHDLEHVVRRCALPSDASYAVLRPTAAPALSDDELRARIASALAGGLSHPGTVAAEILETFAAEVEANRVAAERDAEILRRATEQIDVNLLAHGLCEFSSAESNPFGPRRIYLAGALPIGDVTDVPIAFRDGGELRVCLARVRSEGTAKMTRAERDAATCLPDEIAFCLQQVRQRTAGPRRYSAADFTGDARSVTGRAALVAFRAHAERLIHALASHTSRSALAVYTSELLMSLPVAFGGEVSLTNAIDSIQEALRSFVRSRTTRTYGIQGRIFDGPEPTWPTNLIAPDAIPREVLKALARGSAWKWGELLRPPSPEQEREIRLALDPQAFERVIVDAVGDALEVRSAALYDRLHAENLTAGATPSPAERARVRVALEALGFARAEGADPDGRRCRVWRRPARAATARAPEVERGPCAPHV